MAKTKKANTKNKKDSDKSDKVKENAPKSIVDGGIDWKPWIKRLGILAALLILAWFLLQKLFVVARVNGEPIYRYGFVIDLEQTYGSQLLDQRVTEMLVEQEAASNGVVITQDQVDEQMQQLEQQVSSQGQDFDQLLSMQGMDRQTLREQIRLRKMVEALTPQPEDPSEEEISTFLEQMAGSFDEEMSEEDIRNTAISQINQQKLSEASQKWIEELKTNASIEYLRNY